MHLSSYTDSASKGFINDTIIRDIRTRILDVPTMRKHKLSSTSITHQNYVYVEIILDNGVIGYGEASTLGGPRWAEESVEAIKVNIDTYLTPALIGKPACYIEDINTVMEKTAKRNFSAKSALNMALMDALGHTLDESVSALLGGAVRDRISVIWALASGDVAQEIEEAKSKIENRQFNRFKIKLGFSDIKNDLKRLESLRQNLPQDTDIIADINQGWTESEFNTYIPALEELDISLIEQPLDAGNMEGMSRIARNTSIPLMLDESVFTFYEAKRGVNLSSGSVLSLKLCKHGSLQMTQHIANIAVQGGQELYGGCLIESGLGTAGHLAVFATLPELTWGCEHFGPLILSKDTICDGLVYRDFHLYIPTGVGLGVKPNPDVINQFTRKD